MRTRRKAGSRRNDDHTFYPPAWPAVKNVDTAWMESHTAGLLVAMRDGSRVEASLDLGLSVVEVERNGPHFVCGSFAIEVDAVAMIARSRHLITRLDASGRLVPLRLVHDGRLHQLVPTAGAPTVMIAGIQMHRRDDPWADAAAKAKAVVRRGDWVLDTCGGLGYTAAWALREGAGLVISTEPNPAIRWLRENNPWSPPPSTSGLVTLAAPAEVLVTTVPGETFDAVVHDPPRFSLAGELYSGSFYAALRRVLRTGGRLYHYTGMPHRKLRGRSFQRRTALRLAAAGFSVTWDDTTAGFVGCAR